MPLQRGGRLLAGKKPLPGATRQLLFRDEHRKIPPIPWLAQGLHNTSLTHPEGLPFWGAKLELSYRLEYLSGVLLFR